MTVYRLANLNKDYDKCIEYNGGDGKGFGDPVIMALRDDDLVGCISSFSVDTDYSISNVKADSVFILMKMFNLYDDTMRYLNKERYMIHINKNSKSAVRILDNHKDVWLFNETDDFLWYVRELE